MPSNRSVSRILVNITLDGALAAVAAPVARWIADPGGGLLHPLWFIAGGGITLLLGGLPFRLSQQYWRFAGISDLAGVVGGSVASAAMFSALLLLTGFPLPTITFPIIHAFVLASFLGAPRLAYRLYHGRSRVAADDPRLQRVLLIGAGEAADGFLRALAGQREAALRVTGIVALAERQTGRRMHGRPILGAIGDIGPILARLRKSGRMPDALVLAEPDFRGPRLADLLAAGEAEGLTVQRAPLPTAFTDADRIALRPIAIEDLLNRPQVTLDHAGMARLIGGRRVLVTGAGGSIGSELARQIAERAPAEIVLLDSSEYALWQIDLEFSESFPHVPRLACLADVRDEARIQAICVEKRPELVFHAAALKHVPMVEANQMEGLLTNAYGTRIVADAARASGAAVTVLISTDKAVNPSSLMGASKRLAEMYCQALDIEGRATGGMRCVTVRFGNVLGSTGSVVPLFRRQLERGGPLTVTHPDMQRYFMTVREAVSLVLQACVAGMGEAVMAGGDLSSEDWALINRGGIFVLDMGKPVRILDLARQMIVLAGLRPDKDIEIRFSGLRPGEKLFEELFHGREPPVPTGHAGLLMAVPRTTDAADMRAAIEDIAHYAHEGDAASALGAVRRLVPEFVSGNQKEQREDWVGRAAPPKPPVVLTKPP
jgi:FlaA1/EpsC-like NDP-sugar epimerase